MDINLLIRGIIIGFSIAAPVGPIGVLCMRRTLTEGRASGFVSGLGAATADAIYGCIAGFGLTFISNLLVGQQVWIRLVGGLFLCYLGIKTFLAQPSEQAKQVCTEARNACRDLCRAGHREHKRGLRLCGNASSGGVRRFGPVVAPPGQHR